MFTQQEIAQLLGKTEAAVRQNLHAARKRLTKYLAEIDDDGKPPLRHRGGGPMSASGPGHDGPDEQESLEELFGTVFDLAGEIASRISQDQVEARLRRTLQAAGRHQEEEPARKAARRDPEGAGPGTGPRSPR